MISSALGAAGLATTGRFQNPNVAALILQSGLHPDLVTAAMNQSMNQQLQQNTESSSQDLDRSQNGMYPGNMGPVFSTDMSGDGLSNGNYMYDKQVHHYLKTGAMDRGLLGATHGQDQHHHNEVGISFDPTGDMNSAQVASLAAMNPYWTESNGYEYGANVKGSTNQQQPSQANGNNGYSLGEGYTFETAFGYGDYGVEGVQPWWKYIK